MIQFLGFMYTFVQGWTLYPISEAAPEHDPKNLNRNLNRSSKISEGVLN